MELLMSSRMYRLRLVSALYSLTYNRFWRAYNFQLTCLRSSPGTYSRCDENSTLNPTYGLRCRPCMKPSTIDRARSSILSSREKNAGSTSSRVSNDIRDPNDKFLMTND